MPKTESIADQNAVEVPLYTCLDAARYLRVPVWLALSAYARSPDSLMEYFVRFWHKPLRTLLTDDYGPVFGDDRAERISFHSLGALFIYSAFLRPLLSGSPRPPWHSEEAFHLLDQLHPGGQRVLGDPKIFTDPDWVLDQSDRIFGRVEAPDRAQLLKLIVVHQSRVETTSGIPVRLYPFSREPTPDAPRIVVIDPEIRFGRPAVKGAPTDVLVERWRAGDNSAELADDYGLTTDEVDEALRYETIPYLTPYFFPLSPIGW